MPFPVTPTTVVDAYTNLRAATINCQSYSLLVQSTLAQSPPVTSSTVLALLASAVNLAGVAAQIQADTTLTNNLEAYVQNVTGQSTLNVQAEFAAALTALQALIAAIQQDYPVDSNGHLLDRTFSSGNVAAIGFTAAQLPNTTAAITAWLATIQ